MASCSGRAAPCTRTCHRPRRPRRPNRARLRPRARLRLQARLSRRARSPLRARWLRRDRSLRRRSHRVFRRLRRDRPSPGIASEGRDDPSIAARAAMASLPRERFVPEQGRAIAYADEALPIPAGQTISQPWIVARMTELLAPRVGDRVLDIGTGSGYQAAILALLGARVVSIERQPELAESARARL